MYGTSLKFEFTRENDYFVISKWFFGQFSDGLPIFSRDCLKGCEFVAYFVVGRFFPNFPGI